MLTKGPQLDAPLGDALRYPAKLIDEFAWETPLGDVVDMQGGNSRRLIVKEPVGVVGRHHPLELPVRGHHQQVGPGPGHRQHRGAQAGAGHAVERRTSSAGSSPERTDFPAGVRQRRDLVGPHGRRGADAVAPGRPHLLHRFDRGRQAHHGEGRGHHEAAVPRVGRQVGHHRARRRRLLRSDAHGPGRVHPRRPGMCHPDPDAAPPFALRRGRRAAQDLHGDGALRRSAARRRASWARSSTPSSATG